MFSNARSLFRNVGWLLVVSACLAVLLLQTVPGAAAPLQQGALHRVYITDVRDVQFVVSWTTDSASDGSVDWGTSTALGATTADSAITTTHYVRLTGLLPSTPYYFRVRSGALVDDNGGAYYTATTGPTLGIPPTGKFVYGYVYLANGTTPVSNTVVYLQVQDANSAGSSGSSQWVTARTDATGGWFFNNLNDLRTSNAGAYFTFSDSADNLSRTAQGGSLGTAAQVVAVPGTYPAQLSSLTLNNTPNAVGLADLHAQSASAWQIITILVVGVLFVMIILRISNRRFSTPRKS